MTSNTASTFLSRAYDSSAASIKLEKDGGTRLVSVGTRATSSASAGGGGAWSAASLEERAIEGRAGDGDEQVLEREEAQHPRLARADRDGHHPRAPQLGGGAVQIVERARRLHAGARERLGVVDHRVRAVDV